MNLRRRIANATIAALAAAALIAGLVAVVDNARTPSVVAVAPASDDDWNNTGGVVNLVS